MKWKEEQLQEGVTRQLNLMKTEKQLKDTVTEKSQELRELRLELDREKTEGGKKEREIDRFTRELDVANTTIEQLKQKVIVCVCVCVCVCTLIMCSSGGGVRVFSC